MGKRTLRLALISRLVVVAFTWLSCQQVGIYKERDRRTHTSFKAKPHLLKQNEDQHIWCVGADSLLY